jgi:hypothetical protein
VRLACSRAAAAAARALARRAGVTDPPVRWRMVDGSPWFDNVVGTLRIDGRRMDLAIEKSLPGARLETVLEQRLA